MAFLRREFLGIATLAVAAASVAANERVKTEGMPMRGFVDKRTSHVHGGSQLTHGRTGPSA